MAINTWGGAFTAATEAAYLSLLQGTLALDAVQLGCATCERNRCDTTVGYGGSPDEQCETTLDALLMDGTTLAVGAVAGLRRVRNAVGVARAVLQHTRHSLLVGDLATQFAVENGFMEEDLSTPESKAQCQEWRRRACQPNFRVDVSPDPGAACGPYEPVAANVSSEPSLGMQGQLRSHGPDGEHQWHDTIAMIAIDSAGTMAAGTSTNGAAHKVPGRVGDSPIPGSGAYVDGEVGGCGATGDGDVIMRFLPCYQAVESLRKGMAPREAAEDAVRRMVRRYPGVRSGVVVVDREGEHGGAGSGWTFTYAYRGGDMDAVEVVTVPPLELRGSVPFDDILDAQDQRALGT